jgi:hypothetical protein
LSAFDFQPINCRECGHLVWDGLSASGIPIKLDMTRLNIVDEIHTLVGGGRTYQIHRTAMSFEATRRTSARMKAVDPIVLATHTCRTEGFLFGQEPPDYFNQRKPQPLDYEKVPF